MGRVFFAASATLPGACDPQGQLLYAGPMGMSELHAHHAYQIVLGAGAEMVMSDADGRVIRCAAAVIPPDTPHGRTEPALAGVLLYVDPEDRAGRALRRILSSGASAPEWALAGAPLASLAPVSLPETWDQAAALHAAIVDALLGPVVRPQPVHPAVIRARRQVWAGLDGTLRVRDLAAEAGVSASRLSHLFSDEVGIPLRRYILWARMQRAAESMQRGETLTEAAHAAGFTDGAHLSHAFRRMFGMSPSDAAGAVEWVVPPST